jgi:curved DNA-binding protein CbpA
METLYDVLGARPDDDAESLKTAYHKSAKANHPDRHACDPGALVRFREIVTAYDILRDAKRRDAYDRLLERQRGPLRSKASRDTSHLAYQFVFNVIARVVVGIVLTGGSFLAGFYATGNGAGEMTAGPPPRMVAKRADTANGEPPSHGPARAPRMLAVIPVTQGPAASTVEGKGAREAAQGPSAPDAVGQTRRLIFRRAVEQSTEQKTAAMSQDEICKRGAARLKDLRISQVRDEVIRFERDLGCEKLRPQVMRLRESVDPQ